MIDDDRDDAAEGTVLDPHMARPRLKEGLVPPETGIFLRIDEGGADGRVITLSTGGTFLLGREGADICLDDSKVSRKHAEISLLGPGAYFLRDLASTNGTFLNGHRIADRTPLRHEDTIRLGDTVLKFAVIEESISMKPGQ